MATEKRNIKQMVKEYGYANTSGIQCGECCNCQRLTHDKSSKLMCIAYGVIPDVDCVWDPQNSACGLFNIPFLGLTPRHTPLAEYLFKPQLKADRGEAEQVSLF